MQHDSAPAAANFIDNSCDIEVPWGSVPLQFRNFWLFRA